MRKRSEIARERAAIAPRVEVDRTPLDEQAAFVTLENGDEWVPPGAFARIRPVEGQTPAEVEAWRQRVARVARAVRVLPIPRADVVPAAERASQAVETPRQAAEAALAAANLTRPEEVRAHVESCLAEAGL